MRGEIFFNHICGRCETDFAALLWPAYNIHVFSALQIRNIISQYCTIHFGLYDSRNLYLCVAKKQGFGLSDDYFGGQLVRYLQKQEN